MKKIKKAYYYIFYKIYKSIIYTSEMVGGEFWTDFKAGIALLALELLFLGSFLNYYSIIINEKLDISITSPIILIPLIILFVINYFSFIHTDMWKEYNKQFDKLPEEKNRKGTIVVWIIAIFILINFFGSAYYLQKYILKMY
ncbi:MULTISPECIES: hypothetical protein [unclassified Chryseobacterium]|uniref:hypothetical protein n=1 Tax=unclassified Chryseobacterium TaxID=2593645 RepID=UPI000E0AE334|nr:MULTISPECIES: hypothetical protein [unclassified Chryseobacterium]MDQ1856097.1 hypothetical protein [Chryseobacterium sp. WLY505]